MAAQEIGSVRALLTATSAIFEKDMKDAKNSVRRHGSDMQKALDGISKKFAEVGTALNRYAGIAAVGAATGFAYFIKKQIDAADAIGKMAQATGNSTEFLSSMGFVAEQSGTSLEAVAKATQRLTKNMDDFRRNTGEAKDAFKDLNISVSDGEGVLRKSEDVLLDIAEKFKGLEDGAEKSALAVKLFGRAGTELIPMLNAGRDGIERLQARAQELGLVIGQETATQAAIFNDRLHELQMASVGFGRSIAYDMLPRLNEAIQTIRSAYEESGLLNAIWVALGEAGSAAFTPSLNSQIKRTNKLLEEQQSKLEEHQRKVDEYKRREYDNPGWLSGFMAAKDNAINEATVADAQKNIARLRAELGELEAQQEAAAWAERARREAAIQKLKDEAEARRKNTEVMREQADARIKSEADMRKAQAEEDARLRAQEAATKAIEDQIRALEIQRDTFGMSAEAATLYKISLMEGVTPAQIELARAVLDTIAAMQSEADMMKEIEKAFAMTKEKGKSELTELQRAVEGWGKDSARAITDFAITGKQSFSDMAQSIIADIIQMVIYQRMIKPIFDGISTAMGPSTTPAPASSAYVPGAMGMAKGGIISEPIFGIGKSGQTYAFGEGGIHEAVIPLTNGATSAGSSLSGIGGSVAVENNITIQGGQGTPKVSEQQNGTGGMDIEVVFDQMMSSKLAQRGSQSNRALRNTYGAREGLISR
jgi:hypothetical protein